MECEAGSVRFPQPLAPCGTGMSAVSRVFSGREFRNCRREERAHLPPLGYSRGRGVAAFSFTRSSWLERFC